MPNCRRAFVPGGSWFFAVNLLDRRSALLTHRIDALRDATGRTRQRFPFTSTHSWCCRTISARHVEYCYINPLKHGRVTRVRDWPHSSFHRDVRAGIFPEDWAGEVDPAGEFGERNAP